MAVAEHLALVEGTVVAAVVVGSAHSTVETGGSRAAEREAAAMAAAVRVPILAEREGGMEVMAMQAASLAAAAVTKAAARMAAVKEAAKEVGVVAA